MRPLEGGQTATDVASYQSNDLLLLPLVHHGGRNPPSSASAGLNICFLFRAICARLRPARLELIEQGHFQPNLRLKLGQLYAVIPPPWRAAASQSLVREGLPMRARP